MNQINNCKITKVKTKITDDLTTTVKLEFVSHRDSFIGIFTEKFYVRRLEKDSSLKKIMEYADVKNVKALKGRVLREVSDEDGKFIGIGHPIFDEYILFSDASKTYSASELTK